MLEMRPQSGRPARSRSALIGGALIATLLFLFLRRPTEKGEVTRASDEADVAAQTSRWPKRRVIKDLETLWEVPDKAPKGVLFVAHGCNHAGSDWWPPSPRCEHCLGLPEEMIVRKAALKRGYAVIAITSFDRDSMCWRNTAPSRSEDLQRVPGILRGVIKEERLGKVPLFTFGASSGGGFALRTAAVMPEVKGVISQITPVNPSIFASLEGGRKYPPTLFVHMAQRDPSKAETVAEALKILGKAGVPAAEIRIDPQPLTPQFLQRSPLISAEVAQAICDTLRDKGLIDKDGNFEDDPRSTARQWRELLKPVVGDLSLEADVSQVAELFNVAFARHEIVGDTTDISLAWLEAGGKKSLEELQQAEDKAGG